MQDMRSISSYEALYYQVCKSNQNIYERSKIHVTFATLHVCLVQKQYLPSKFLNSKTRSNLEFLVSQGRHRAPNKVQSVVADEPARRTASRQT